MSAGTIIESMSSKKLTYLMITLAILQLFSFLVGLIVAPNPNNSLQVLATKCIASNQDLKNQKDKWYYPRGKGKCKQFDDFSEVSELRADNVVFSFQIPHPRENQILEFSRWQQVLMGVLSLDIEYQKEVVHDPKVQLMFKSRLAYRNRGDADDDWKLLYDSFAHRVLECDIDEHHKNPGYMYNCSLLNLFELGSLHHNYYLLNLQLPAIFDNEGEVIDIKNKLGKLTDIWLTSIFQNGGFTKVWLSLKTIFFPFILGELIWFWRRIQQLPRNSTLIERMLLALSISLTFLNLPLEYFTLYFDMPWLTLYNDLKQGVFYATLMTFWLVFTGEHCINETGETGEKHGIMAYWKKLAVVFFGSLCLLIFDICERGIQLQNPFYSIWATEIGSDIALTFIILAGISAGVYFLFICYMVYKVSMNLSQKQSSIAAMSSVRRLHYTGIIWRFRFLQLSTLVTSALTCIGFIMGRVSEGSYKWDEDLSVEFASGFQTGVYGMWNIYIFALIFLYAPSHKNWPVQRESSDTQSANNGEEIEFSLHGGACTDPSEFSSLTEFMKHQATD